MAVEAEADCGEGIVALPLAYCPSGLPSGVRVSATDMNMAEDGRLKSVPRWEAITMPRNGQGVDDAGD